MGRRPLDAISQAELVLALKVEIDRARHTRRGSSEFRRGIAAIATLLEANPQAATRIHVTSNLGHARRAFLFDLAGDPALEPMRSMLLEMGS